jgi:hypothetical protein
MLSRHGSSQSSILKPSKLKNIPTFSNYCLFTLNQPGLQKGWENLRKNGYAVNLLLAISTAQTLLEKEGRIRPA